MSKDSKRMSLVETALVNLHKDLAKKQSNQHSDSEISKLQHKRKEIRDTLVSEHDWTRREANKLTDY